jgi:hypothetical protein
MKKLVWVVASMPKKSFDLNNVEGRVFRSCVCIFETLDIGPNSSERHLAKYHSIVPNA